MTKNHAQLHLVQGGLEDDTDDESTTSFEMSVCQQMVALGEQLEASFTPEQAELWDQWIEANGRLYREGTKDLKKWQELARELQERPVSSDLLAIADSLRKASLVHGALAVTKICAAMLKFEKDFPDLYTTFAARIKDASTNAAVMMSASMTAAG